jgi:hypothetical protein
MIDSPGKGSKHEEAERTPRRADTKNEKKDNPDSHSDNAVRKAKSPITFKKGIKFDQLTRGMSHF